MNRKHFLKSSAIIAASSIFSRSNLLASSSGLIRVGLIGANGMGWTNLNALLKNKQVICTALCDVDENVLQRRAAELYDRGIHVATYINYKDLLADQAIDAVIIASPDHWHCLQMMDAVDAGKHIYIEKPIGNSIEECRLMLERAQRSSNIIQVGQWQRSQQHFRDAIAYLHQGHLGKVRLVKAWSYVDWKKPISVRPDEAVPAHVHYDMWLGPAQKRPFNPNRFHFEFRWFWDYAGGLMTDWGVHMLDYALLGMQVATPLSVMSSGGNFADPHTAAETPDTLTTVYEFPEFNIQWEHAVGLGQGPYNRTHGVAFIGNNGTLILNREGWEVIPEKGKMEAVPFQKSLDHGLERHMENFVDAIIQKDPKRLHAPVEAGVHIAIFSQMGNIAYRTGQKLYWNNEEHRFYQEEANQFLMAAYHNGYTVKK